MLVSWIYTLDKNKGMYSFESFKYLTAALSCCFWADLTVMALLGGYDSPFLWYGVFVPIVDNLVVFL